MGPCLAQLPLLTAHGKHVLGPLEIASATADNRAATVPGPGQAGRQYSLSPGDSNVEPVITHNP